MAQNGPRFGLILTLAKVPIVVKAVIRPSDQIMINMSPLYMDSSVHTSKFLIRLKTLTYIRLFGGDAIS